MFSISSTVAGVLWSICRQLEALLGDGFGGESLAELAEGDTRVLAEMFKALLRKATEEVRG